MRSTSILEVPLEDENVGKPASLATLHVDADTKYSRRRPEASLRSAPHAGDLALASIPTMTGVLPNGHRWSEAVAGVSGSCSGLSPVGNTYQACIPEVRRNPDANAVLVTEVCHDYNI